MLQKKTVLTAGIIYEAIKLIAIITSRPQSLIAMLPLSWYAAAPLLCLPLILLCIIRASSHDSLAEERIYTLIKILSLMGFAAYFASYMGMGRPLLGAIRNMPAFIPLLLIFFIIDGIILCMLCLKNREQPPSQREIDTTTKDNGDT